MFNNNIHKRKKKKKKNTQGHLIKIKDEKTEK